MQISLRSVLLASSFVFLMGCNDDGQQKTAPSSPKAPASTPAPAKSQEVWIITGKYKVDVPEYLIETKGELTKQTNNMRVFEDVAKTRTLLTLITPTDGADLKVMTEVIAKQSLERDKNAAILLQKEIEIKQGHKGWRLDVADKSQGYANYNSVVTAQVDNKIVVLVIGMVGENSAVAEAEIARIIDSIEIKD